MVRVFTSMCICLIALGVQAQNDHFLIKAIKEKDNLSFPMIAPKAAEHSGAALRINRLLQLLQLKLIILDHTRDAFEEVSTKEDPTLIGYRGMNFGVTTNSDKILSLAFDESSCGAACFYWNVYYNFNAGNGDLIQLKDLIVPGHYKMFKSWLLKRQSAQFKREFAKVQKHNKEAKHLTDIHLNNVLESFRSEEFLDFYIRENVICVDGSNSLPKECKFLGINVLCKLTASELAPYLNDYGKVVLGLQKGAIHTYRSASLPQVFAGHVAGQPIVLTLHDYGTQNLDGMYAYLKYGKAISLSGTLKQGVLNLKEEGLYEGVINGYINAQWKGDSIIGKWYDADSSKNYSLKINR